MADQFPVKGLAELNRYLSALPANMQKAAFRGALTAAAAPVRDKARELVGRKSGKTAKAIKTGSARQNPDGTYSIRVRLDGAHSFVGYFLEYGVAPHFIQSGDSGVSPRKLTQKLGGAGAQKSDSNDKVLKIGDQWVSGAVLHPGFAPQPFLRPALDMMADEAVQGFASKIRDFLEKKTGFAPPVGDE